ncbi:MAG: FkbM family methyltransferase [Nanoarchaeota archaeon]
MLLPLPNSTLTRIGSDYGGWIFDINLIKDNTNVISAGLATDVTFDTELLILKKVFIIGIDPTHYSAGHIDNLFKNGILNRNNYLFHNCCLYGSDNTQLKVGGPASSVFANEGIDSISISLNSLLDKYNNFSILKMDIEGSEYSVIENTSRFDMPQIGIEFHHWLDKSPYKLEDTVVCMNKLKSFGYKMVYKEKTGYTFQNTLFIKKELCPQYEDLDENSTVEYRCN